MEGMGQMEKVNKIWNGAAAIIVENNRILMVKEKESMNWSVPSGEIEKDENPEQACIREVWEETGFKVEVKEPIHIKRIIIRNYDVTPYYFLCQVIEGRISYQDPDDEIEEIGWKTAEDISTMQHDYPEDLELLLTSVEKDFSEAER